MALGYEEWMLIFVMALLVLGGKKLPPLSDELWKSMEQRHQSWQTQPDQAPIRSLSRRLRMFYLLETTMFAIVAVLFMTNAITLRQAAMTTLVFTAWVIVGVICFINKD